VKIRENYRIQSIVGIKGSNEDKAKLSPSVHLNVLAAPIEDPILFDPAFGIELPLGFTIAPHICKSRRQDLDDQLGRCPQVPCRICGHRQPSVADPDHIRSHRILGGKDHAG
jgi:hypothetical protein